MAQFNIFPHSGGFQVKDELGQVFKKTEDFTEAIKKARQLNGVDRNRRRKR